MALRDILVDFVTKVSGKEQFEELSTTIQSTINDVRALATAFGALSIGKALAGGITDVIDMGAKLGYMADRLGLGTQELQSFQFAARMTGGDAEQAGKALQYLNRHVGLAADGSKAAEKDFAQLGVSIQGSNGKIKPLSELIPEVSDAFAKLPDDARRAEYATKLFSRAGYGLLPLLKGGKDGLGALTKKFDDLGIGLRDDFIGKAKEANQSLTILGMSVDATKSRLVLALLPALEKGAEVLTKVSKFFADMADKTYVAKTALIALGVAGAIAFAPLLIELAPVLLLFGGLYLLFDDIFTLFAGGKSVIGDVIDLLFGEGASATFVEEVKKQATELWDTFKSALPTIKDVGHWLREAFEGAAPYLRTLLHLVEGVMETFAGLAKIAIHAAKGDWGAVGDDALKLKEQLFGADGAINKAVNGGQVVQKNSSGGLQNVVNGDPWADRVALPKAEVNPGPGAANGAGGGGDVNIQNTTHINVNGAQTNDETGQKVADAVDDAHATNNRNAANALRGARGKNK